MCSSTATPRSDNYCTVWSTRCLSARLNGGAFFEQDASLTLAQKNGRLNALRAKLPPEQHFLIPHLTDGDVPQPAAGSVEGRGD